jgi:hypothetical protein
MAEKIEEKIDKSMISGCGLKKSLNLSTIANKAAKMVDRLNEI